MTSIAVSPSTLVVDPKTGRLTREGFLLFSSVIHAVNDATTAYVTADAEQTLDNKTISGYTKTAGLVTLLIADSVTDGVLSKAPTENAVFDALAGKQGTTSWSGRTMLIGTATYDPASLADGAGTTTTVTVTGAVLGNMVLASFSLDLQGITLTAYVSAADTVSVRFQNESGGTLDLASGTLTAWVIA